MEELRELARIAVKRRNERMTEEEKEAQRSKLRFIRIMSEIRETPEMKAARRERNRIYQRNYMKDPEKKKRWLQLVAKSRGGKK